VDVPWGKNQSRSLTVINETTREETPISEVWHLAPTIFNKPTAYSAPIRVFISPTLYRKRERELGSICEAALENFLIERKSRMKLNLRRVLFSVRLRIARSGGQAGEDGIGFIPQGVSFSFASNLASIGLKNCPI